MTEEPKSLLSVEVGCSVAGRSGSVIISVPVGVMLCEPVAVGSALKGAIDVFALLRIITVWLGIAAIFSSKCDASAVWCRRRLKVKCTLMVH